MKYLLGGLALVAAVAALFFRPPHGEAPTPAAIDSGAVTSRSPLPQAPTIGSRTPSSRRIVVYVAGEVVKPGVYTLVTDTRAQDALARAGGPKPDADLVAVNLAAPLTDGEEIAFPKIGAATPRTRRAAAPRVRSAHAPRTNGHGRRRRASPASQTVSESQRVDLNSADAGELETLPGIGPELAARIVAYRETNGPFASTDELADISGITPRVQAEITDLVVVR